MSMACNPGKYEKSEHGITVNVTPTGENSVIKVRLQVMDDKIIRVSATLIKIRTRQQPCNRTAKREHRIYCLGN